MSDVSKIIVDKNKTAEQYMQEALDFYIIPDLIKNNYPNLIKLVFEAESMNDEEREYWLQIMPIMDVEQVEKLMEILNNEKTQLKKIEDQKQAEIEKSKATDQAAVDQEALTKARMQKLAEDESKFEDDEIFEEEDLLKQIEDLEKPQQS